MVPEKQAMSVRSVPLLSLFILAVAVAGGADGTIILSRCRDQSVPVAGGGARSQATTPGSLLLVGAGGKGGTSLGLLGFDLSPLPAWKDLRERHVRRATLELTVRGIDTDPGSGPARLSVAMLDGRNQWRPGRATASQRDGGKGWIGDFPDQVRSLWVGEVTATGAGVVSCDVTAAVLDWMQGLQDNAGFVIRVARPPRMPGAMTIRRMLPEPEPFQGMVALAAASASTDRPRIVVEFGEGPPRFRPPVTARTKLTKPYRIGYVGGDWVFQRPDLFGHLTVTTAGAATDEVRRMNHYGMQVLRWAPGPSQLGTSVDWFASRFAAPAGASPYAGIGADEWGGTPERRAFCAEALRRYRRDHPDHFIAVWEINRGPELQALLRDGTVDVALIEGYVHMPNQHGWRADFTETMRRAGEWKKAGLIDKVVIGWGHMVGDSDDTDVAMAPGHLDWMMREAKRRFPEMPGTGFFFATQGGWSPMNVALLTTARDLSYELYPRPEDPPLRSAAPPLGDRQGSGILWEQWSQRLPDLAEPGRIPTGTRPAKTRIMPTFVAPRNAGNHCGARMRGWLRPPVDGDYVFAIAADDRSELWLSTDEHPERRRRIAGNTVSTDVAEFHRQVSKQRSQPIPLKGGRIYYIEALHCDDTDSDHLAVAWEGPGFNQQIIDGCYLVPAGDSR
jgi:hypothetical protein